MRRKKRAEVNRSGVEKSIGLGFSKRVEPTGLDQSRNQGKKHRLHFQKEQFSIYTAGHRKKIIVKQRPSSVSPSAALNFMGDAGRGPPTFTFA